MDLRYLRLTDQMIEDAAHVLNYQPFIITSELQTGVGYSILYSTDPRVAPPLVFQRHDWSSEDWARVTSANQSLRTMYDTFVQTIVSHYPGGSLLDVACNNGYIPVAAQKAGMRECAGMDRGAQYKESVKFLNRVLGTDVGFFHRCYSPIERRAEPLPRKFDVVCVSAILCHLPDPLHFLAYIASVAIEAVFFWGQIIDTEHFIISYNKPHPNLGDLSAFPYDFNDNTRISMGLFRHALASLGFTRVIEVPYTQWIPENLDKDIESQLTRGSRHKALLFMR